MANNGPLAFSKKKADLERVEDPHVTWGYDPLRRGLAGLLQATGDMFSAVGVETKYSDERVLAALSSACKKDERQRKACLSSATVLLEWRDVCKMRAVRLDPAPLPYKTPVDQLQFAHDVALIADEKIFLFYFDPRSSLTLTDPGREFVKSLMWHSARIGNVRDAQIALLQTPSSRGGRRTVRFDILEGEPLYSLDAIDEMILETYRVWELILMERRRGANKLGNADDGGLI